MVSAAGWTAQEAALAARPYAEKLEEVLQNLAAQSQALAHPLLTAREEKNIDLLLITSDRGLCGGFNANLVRAAEAFAREASRPEGHPFTCRPARVRSFQTPVGEIAEQHINLFGRLTPTLAHEIGARMSQRFLNGETDGEYVLYARSVRN